MKEFLFMVLLLLAVEAAFGQSKFTPYCNVSVGSNTVMAVYPDEIEFLLIAPYGRLMIVEFDENCEDVTKAYAAKITKVSPHIFRAEVSADFWVEVYADTGTTIFSNGVTQAFFRPKQ